ncbi:MAG: flagellar basal body rod protein FlgC [candidate division Zixibacteria bacterium]|nr:flagellar basal body rod protein FlgC [candidate division Zixibacteria bacterium]
MGGILNAIEVSAQGLSVQRARMDAVAQNMANAETAETKEGGPYRRKRVMVEEEEGKASFRSQLNRADTRLARTNRAHRSGGMNGNFETVSVSAVSHQEVADPESSFRLDYDPTHPKADADGYVKMPDIEVVDEMVDMMVASRAYEANTAVISTAKKMAMDALDI